MRSLFIVTKEFFTPPEFSPEITIFWGTEGYDTQYTELWDTSIMGDLVWDDDFKVSTPEA